MFRFAPTPSGFLHLGNAASMVLTYVLAKAAEKKILLRIDDIDAARARDVYIEDLFRCLDWLGIEYDLGPQNLSDFKQTWSQQHRYDLYFDLIRLLENKGLVYKSNTSKKELELAENKLTCLRTALPLQTQTQITQDFSKRILVDNNWKVSLNDQLHPPTLSRLVDNMQDPVILRRDGVPAYQIASLADDLHFGVNSWVRGLDLIDSTALQFYMLEKVESPFLNTLKTWHHPLVVDEHGKKLSKSEGASSIKALRHSGASVALVYNLVANWLKINPKAPIQSITELQVLYREAFGER